MYLRLINKGYSTVYDCACAVNSYSFLFGCWRDFRMTAIMMTAIMAMPTSTQLARTEPTTMTIEIPFDDESCSEIQSVDELAS